MSLSRILPRHSSGRDSRRCSSLPPRHESPLTPRRTGRLILAQPPAPTLMPGSGACQPRRDGQRGAIGRAPHARATMRVRVVRECDRAPIVTRSCDVPLPGSGTTAGPPSFAEARNRHQKVRAAGLHPNYWYPVEYDNRVRRGQVVEVRFWGQSIALYRGADGRLRALENRCAHRQLPLSLGDVTGCALTCAYHGWSYRGDGRLSEIPHEMFGQSMPAVRLTTYPAAGAVRVDLAVPRGTRRWRSAARSPTSPSSKGRTRGPTCPSTSPGRLTTPW